MRLPGEERPEAREVRDVVESLRFCAEDLEKIDIILAQYVRSASARCAMLVDRDGRMIAECGARKHAPQLAQLAAASFEATELFMRMFDRQGALRFYQGRSLAVELTLVGERALLATAFDEATTLGMVRLYELQASSRLRSFLAEIAERTSQAESISKDFSGRGGPPTPPLAMA